MFLNHNVGIPPYGDVMLAMFVWKNGLFCFIFIYFWGVFFVTLCTYDLREFVFINNFLIHIFRDLGSQGLKGYISDKISLLSNLVNL